MNVKNNRVKWQKIIDGTYEEVNKNENNPEDPKRKDQIEFYKERLRVFNNKYYLNLKNFNLRSLLREINQIESLYDIDLAGNEFDNWPQDLLAMIAANNNPYKHEFQNV